MNNPGYNAAHEAHRHRRQGRVTRDQGPPEGACPLVAGSGQGPAARSRHLRMGTQVAAASVLNDVALSKGALSHMVQLEISIDGQFVTGLRGDGLIISTPTGSTAYSMAAGGPILNPAVHALILTPICPHTLTNRPIVIPQEAHVAVMLVSKDEGAMVTFDGQAGIALQPRDLIEVRASENKTRLIRFADRTYYDMLRKKLKWGES